MIIQRYYATLMALGIEALKTSTGVDLDASSMVVAGGSPVVMGSIEGNEYWELLPPALSGTTPWYPPFLPKDPTLVDATYGSTMWRWGQTTTPEGRLNSPHYEEFPPSPLTNYDPFARPGTPYADRLFDTYPRMFQTTEGGRILVSGDVEEGAAANEPGTVWVIKPRTESNHTTQSIWESWIGPEGADPGSGDIWHDSFYDNAVILHEVVSPTVRRNDRVLMFCGSRDKNGQNVLPDPITRNWAVNTKVWEFEKGAPDPIVNGTWREKIPTGGTGNDFKRVYANAVILPTGDIFVEGGTSVDDTQNHGAYISGTMYEENASVPVLQPIIYDPGSGPTVGGTIYPQTSNTIPRLYHQVSVLLPDGRVFMAGGQRPEDANGNPLCPPGCPSMTPCPPTPCPAVPDTCPDPRFTGEMFSPPYLDYLNTNVPRPTVITTPPNQISFNNGTSFTFTMRIERRTTDIIDTVVLIRPAAVTHHFDNDQRYIELSFFTTNVEVDPLDPNFTHEDLVITNPDKSLGPAGYYMLFAIETDGLSSQYQGHRVPSLAEFINIQ